MSPNCAVCGVPLSGPAAALLALRGIKRSARNPNACTQCGAHLEEGRLVELTVLFVDLSSFTEMTGRLGAEATYSVVDGYLRAASDVLVAHGATIDKFIGDAVMAFFNAPVKREDHAAAAVAAAVELQKAVPALSEKLGVKLRVSVGVATGFARVGRLGSDDPKDYTAIGDCVNQAARLQAQAKAGEIVVSDSVYAKVAAAYPGLSPERLTLKGFSQPALAYRLNGPPAAPIHDEDWLKRRPAMNWGSVALALLGSGCLGKTFVLAGALAYGAGSAAAFAAFANALDGHPLRLPFMGLAALASLAVLASLLRQSRQRRECRLRNRCVELTPSEKRGAWSAAAVAVLSLALVAFELLSHRFDVGMHRRRVIAEKLSSVLN